MENGHFVNIKPEIETSIDENFTEELENDTDKLNNTSIKDEEMKIEIKEEVFSEQQQEPEPNPLEEMEKEEAEKHTRRRRRGGSGAGMEEDDPLATSIGRLVQRIDSGQKLLQNLVVHLGQANKPQTGREVFMAYVNNLLNVCSVEHFKLLRRTIMQMVEQHGICDPSATPAATPTGYAGQPSPSIFPSPNTAR